MNRLFKFVTCALMLSNAFITSNAWSATEAQKQAAIDSGLEWLAQRQQATGYWDTGDTANDIAATGSALLAFLEEGYSAGTNVVIDGNNYGDVVGDGINYLFNNASRVSINPQLHGNPDTNGDGIGVKFYPGGTNGRDTYVTGLVAPVIAATGTPNAMVSTGALTGMKYKDVMQNVTDYFAFGQNENVTGRGGWRYYANSGSSDNSTAQWPVLAMIYAESMGATTPAFVHTELQHWIDYIQNPNGGSGYDKPSYLVNESKTGALLLEMAFNGTPLSDPDLQAALAYLNQNWRDMASGTWYGNFRHPYAMWGIYKGLETTIGLDDTTSITNLLTDCGASAGNLDAGDTCNWWEDYSQYLVQQQNSDGHWSGYSYWNDTLATSWYINILAATEIPHDDVPEPVTLALFGIGLVGLGLSRRRVKR